MDPFDCLTTTGLRRSLSWLRNLPDAVKTVVEFGCSSSEPYALYLLLQPRRVVSVELEIANLTQSMTVPPVEELDLLCQTFPNLFNRLSVHFVVGDILSCPLPTEFCNLAFCEEVLYYFENDAPLARAISEMVRVVLPGGFIIAVESKVGADHHSIDSIFGPIEVPSTPPRDISPYFEAIGLQRCEVVGRPAYSYCYRKPLSL